MHLQWMHLIRFHIKNIIKAIYSTGSKTIAKEDDDSSKQQFYICYSTIKE